MESKSKLKLKVTINVHLGEWNEQKILHKQLILIYLFKYEPIELKVATEQNIGNDKNILEQQDWKLGINFPVFQHDRKQRKMNKICVLPN